MNKKAVDASLLIMRLIVGVIFAAHGAQLLFGAFGGPGLRGTVDSMGLLGYPVAVGQFFGGIGIFFGFLTRFSAASLIVVMIGAIVKVHLPKGFFIQNGGFEYNIALIGMLLPLLILGPGSYAVGVKLPKWAR